jgi:Nucleotidyl transferase AbiEii toxin, Type IV TA system
MQIDLLNDFSLVGGTALSLRLGHRKSIDLDLFNVNKFSVRELRAGIMKRLSDRVTFHSSPKNPLGIFGYFEGVKLDLCRHNYPLLKPIQLIEGIRMWSLEDIAASKIFAISRRGTKKDFWDLERLLAEFTLDEITGFYFKRYTPDLAISISKMLTWFDEADDSDTPVCLLGKTWTQIKKSISKKINQQTK